MKITSFFSFLSELAEKFPERVALSQLRGEEFRVLNYESLYQSSSKYARFLNTRGVGKNQTVVIISEHRLEWPIFSFGVLMSGAALVPFDVQLTASEMLRLIEYTKPALILYSPSLKEKVQEIKEVIGNKYPATCIDLNYLEKVPEFNHVKLPNIDEKEIGLIVYTSGTSGRPKGVMIKNESIFFEVDALNKKLSPDKPEVFLSVLPVNHLLEFTGGLCLPLSRGDKICIANTLEQEHISFCLNSQKVTQMLTVPLFLTKIKNSILSKVKQQGRLKAAFFNMLFLTGKILPHKMKRYLFKSIHSKLGGLQRFIVGSAALDLSVMTFYHRIGIEICEGYGLTETSPVVSVNTPDHFMAGSVGKPLDGVEVKIADPDEEGVGEVMIKGANVFAGYYQDEELTQKVLNDQGWFASGDLGRLDQNGFLYLTGRLKKMIVLESGKKVYPEEVESLILKDEAIEEAVLVAVSVASQSGKSRQQRLILTAVPSEDFKQAHGQIWEKIEADLKDRLQMLCQDLSPFKKPHDFVIFENEMPKTSTRKIKFKYVENRVQDLYAHG